MAWQLIYTSAPRLLEAGRSGFGTVARHRQISPLLVSAIERASQFARLSGLSADRVIFAHRIIAISGGRFHVLSCIRDSGADYTGRTNHIAHHLIAEHREVARLGPDGPSPADVLLAMTWVATWDDHPRHLDHADEISLASFAPSARTGGAWAAVTGEPEHAWLLASGEASRGAYLIVPTGVDLRELLADSFRLSADHAWPHGFITSLQPSDEASDFRWIGIEEDSPLRSHASASARPVLDLTRPNSLPAPGVPAIPKRREEIQTQSPLQQGTLDFSGAPPERNVTTTTASAVDLTVTGGEALSHVPSGGETPQEARKRELRERAERRSPALTRASPRGSASSGLPAWAWIAMAAVLLGAGACYFALRPMLQRREAQRKVAGLLEPSGYFGDEPARIGIARELVPNAQAEEQAADAARAADRLAWSLSSADFSKIRSSQADADLLSLSGAGGQVPAELGKLRELVRRVLILSEPPDGTGKAQDATALEGIFTERKKEILGLIHGTGREANLSRLAKELIAQADRNHARALLALIQSPILPAEGVKAFEKVTADFARGTSDVEALKTVAQIRETIAQRKRKPRKNPGPAKVEAPPAHEITEVAPFKQTGPIYLLAGNDALAAVKIKELRPGTAFHIATPDRKVRELIVTADKLRLDFQRPSAAFLLGADAQTIRASDDAPKPPYGLFGESKESGKFEIWVVAPGSPKPLPETQNATLTRSADLLHISGALPKFSGVLALFLRAPAGLDAKSEPLSLPVNDAWEADLAPVVSELHKTAAAQRAEARTLRKNAAATKDPPSLEALQKKANEYAKVFTDQYAKREFSPAAKTGNEIVGNYAVALVTEWGKNYDQNLENLRAWGHNLRESDGKPALVKDLNEGLRKEVLALEQKYRSSKMTNALANLRDLANTLATMLGDTKGLEASAKAMADRADAADASADRIEKLPLLTDGRHPPAGDYTLIARTALDREVVIATFKVQKP